MSIENKNTDEGCCDSCRAAKEAGFTPTPRRVPELPTEPGIYMDAKGDPWKLAPNGYWYDKGYVNGSSNRDLAYIRSRAPFTRLVVPS